MPKPHIPLDELRTQVAACHACPLAQTRTQTVFGDGSPTARVLFVGEAPGKNEDLQGVPFVGKAGQNLNTLLEIAGLRREDVFIANVLKCRPPGNRDPLNVERDACSDWLRSQIRLINPKLIVCLGRIAAMEFIDPEFRISRQHGSWVKIDGIWRTALYHPSALLRDPSKRPETFRDLKSLKQMVLEHCPNTILED